MYKGNNTSRVLLLQARKGTERNGTAEQVERSQMKANLFGYLNDVKSEARPKA